jgi:hypothetical protein
MTKGAHGRSCEQLGDRSAGGMLQQQLDIERAERPSATSQIRYRSRPVAAGA